MSWRWARSFCPARARTCCMTSPCGRRTSARTSAPTGNVRPGQTLPAGAPDAPLVPRARGRRGERRPEESGLLRGLLLLAVRDDRLGDLLHRHTAVHRGLLDPAEGGRLGQAVLGLQD